MHREEFVKENLEAVDAIENEWRLSLEQELHRTIDAWFDDAEILLKELRPETI